jgi:Tfp pilus assembly protein PilP
MNRMASARLLMPRDGHSERGPDMRRRKRIKYWPALLALPLLLAAVSAVGEAQQVRQATKAAQSLRATQETRSGAPARKAGAPAAAPAKSQARRDPFAPLVARPRSGAAAAAIPDRLPPGKPGLVIRTLRVDGIVRAPSGMLAVVVNHLQRVHFLREGDQLYDGRVERISMEGVTFREVGRDEMGKPFDRVVVKRLYPSAGEQQ